MRAVFNLFKYKHKKRKIKRTKKPKTDPPDNFRPAELEQDGDPLIRIPNKHDLLDEI